ncbi:MAG: Alpha-D-kanosaminyltransferase [Chloroflexi bacterium ADurb.Bin360]|nr:MAG: Alpha-D-kanosaminyltransferase [Chloroflexi bacterium ADurb.Bin360]
MSCDMVLLAVMHLEPHGGVADQMTTLAAHLPQYGIQPIVVVRNPLAAQHGYVGYLHQRGIAVWAVSDRQRHFAVGLFRWLALCLLPVALVDSIFRRKSLTAARGSLWGLLRRMGYWGLDGLFLLRLFWAYYARRVRVVHFRKPDSWYLMPRAARLGYRVVYTEDTEPRPETEKYYLGLVCVKEHIHTFTAVSRASGDHLQRYIGANRQVVIIPNMVEPPSEPESISVLHQPFVVGFIGRLDPQKNVGMLLMAAKHFLDGEVRLSLFGDGPLRETLEAQALALGIVDKVHFAGAFAREQLPQVMAQIDLLVLPSLWEGFGVVLVEAMAYGKPCVATAVGGIPEVVVDGVTGFLVPPDEPLALAEAVTCIRRDFQTYTQFAKAAKVRFWTNYVPDCVAPQYGKLYGN